MKAAALLVAVAIAGAGALYWMGQDRDLSEPATQPNAAANPSSPRWTAPQRGANAGMPTAGRVVQARVAPGERASVSEDMRQLRDRRNYKELYARLSALPNPTPEQQYIIADIAGQCGPTVQRQQSVIMKKAAADPAQVRADFAAAISEKDPNRDARLAAFDRTVLNPCDGLQLAGINTRSLLEAAAAGGDPKARARLLQQEILNPPGRKPDEPVAGISDAQLATLRQLAASDDPVAATAALQLFSSTMQQFSMRAGPSEAPLDGAAYYAAVQLIGCEMGLDCGRDSGALLQACALQNRCGAMDLRDLLMTYQMPQASAGMVDEYMQGLRRARAGDWSYFTTVRGPTPSMTIFGRR